MYRRVRYSLYMEVRPGIEFRFKRPAFRHGVTEADIRRAFETCRYMGQYGGRENVYLLLGFGTKANPVEVLYNRVVQKLQFLKTFC